MVKKIIILLLLISIKGYSQNLISYITVNPKDAYIGQPVKLTVSVYSSTWFTSGIDVGNIQVDGALTVYFRSVSNTRTFSGKQYAGVDFFYNVFPTKEGQITIPSLTINVESPKTGGYKGIKHIVKTKPKTINIKGVPLGYDPNNWLVATSLNINEKWSVPITNIKVGDVIQRTVNRSAGGTLSEFIPATKWDTVKGISIYPKRPQVKTNKSKTGVSSSRVETVNYLFEKDGKVIIPSIEYVYWNSYNKKFYHKVIDSLVVDVKPNADLAMLASIKKSLQKENKEEFIEEDKSFLILGMTVKEFIKNLLFTLFALFLLFKVLKRLIFFYKQKHSEYLKSESYAFKKVKNAIHKNDYNAFIRTSNLWLSKLDTKNRTLQKFTNNYGTDRLNKVLTELNESNFKFRKTSDKSSFAILMDEINNLRKNYFKEQNLLNKSTLKNKEWLNPIKK